MKNKKIIQSKVSTKSHIYKDSNHKRKPHLLEDDTSFRGPSHDFFSSEEHPVEEIRYLKVTSYNRNNLDDPTDVTTEESIDEFAYNSNANSTDDSSNDSAHGSTENSDYDSDHGSAHNSTENSDNDSTDDSSQNSDDSTYVDEYNNENEYPSPSSSLDINPESRELLKSLFAEEEMLSPNPTSIELQNKATHETSRYRDTKNSRKRENKEYRSSKIQNDPYETKPTESTHSNSCTSKNAKINYAFFGKKQLDKNNIHPHDDYKKFM